MVEEIPLQVQADLLWLCQSLENEVNHGLTLHLAAFSFSLTAFTNTRIAREIEERSRADEIRFKKAGIGPVVKTYAYDPTKQAFAKGAGSSQKINGQVQ